MRNLIQILFLSYLLFALASCDTPQSLIKKGHKLAENKMYYDAANQYMKALDKKSDFVAAKTALKESGQKQVNLYLDDFFKSKNFGEKRTAIYHYVSAKQLKDKTSKYNVNLDIAPTYKKDYTILLNEYVNQIYSESMELLSEENFSESEKLLREIASLKPNFKDVNNLKNVATYEPIYRSANSFLDNEKFRSAYYKFDEIPNTYKETKTRKALALKAGLFTIGIVEFQNASRKKGGESAISAMITDELMKLNNPFIKLVDRKYTQSFIDEQILGLSGQVAENTNAQAGELIGAKAILTGKLVNYSKQHTPIKKTIQKGWLEKNIRKYNSETKKYYYETAYDKIRYNEFKGNTSVQLGFKYQLISSESGEILLSKLINLSQYDEVHFAESNVNGSKIIPGNWRWENKVNQSDVINDSYSDKRALRNLFKNKNKLMSESELANRMYFDIAKEVSQKINDYNPENE